MIVVITRTRVAFTTHHSGDDFLSSLGTCIPGRFRRCLDGVHKVCTLWSSSSGTVGRLSVDHSCQRKIECKCPNNRNANANARVKVNIEMQVHNTKILSGSTRLSCTQNPKVFLRPKTKCLAPHSWPGIPHNQQATAIASGLSPQAYN